jgi:hypothetical protein
VWTFTTGFLLACLNALVEHDVSSPFNGPLEAVWLGLYVAGTPPITANSVIGDIVEANYTGYARQELVWSPPFIDVRGPYTLQAASLFFSPSDSMVSNNITGLFLATLVTAGALNGAQALPSPGQVLAGPTNALTVVPQFQLPFLQIYGGCQVVP